MTDEQWAEYQRQGLHLRTGQRPDGLTLCDGNIKAAEL